MSYNNTTSAKSIGEKSRFVNNFAEKMGMEYLEARQFLNNLVNEEAADVDGGAEAIELMLAVNMSAKLHNVQGKAEFQRFKFMLNNRSRRATHLARMWMDQKITFTEMMESF